jgi:hypothetical protein
LFSYASLLEWLGTWLAGGVVAAWAEDGS